jgi:hypothetical protein
MQKRDGRLRKYAFCNGGYVRIDFKYNFKLYLKYVNCFNIRI